VSIFIDNNYTLYTCDRDNNRVLKYPQNSANSTLVVENGTVVAGNGTAGASATELNSPKGVAVDQMGAVIVADSSNYRIQRFTVGSIVGITLAINSPSNILGTMRDLHIDVNNDIFVTDSDNSRVVKFYPNDGIGVILAGANGPGIGADQLSSPFGNFVDGNQTLYIADYGNQRVQMWPAGAISGITVAGVTNVSGSGLGYLNNPTSIVVDNNGYDIDISIAVIMSLQWVSRAKRLDTQWGNQMNLITFQAAYYIK
jgi:sugar lactone lactonase YvrE